MEGNKKSQSKLILLLIPIIVLLGCLAGLGIYIGNYYSNQAKQEPIPIYQRGGGRYAGAMASAPPGAWTRTTP